jgi:hypothetical protein
VLDRGSYWWLDFDASDLERVPIDGGTPEKVVDVFFGGPITADGDAIYWGDTSLKKIQSWDSTAGLRDLVDADPDALASADGVIYWLDGFIDGSLRSVTAQGQTAKSLLCGLDGPELIFVAGPYLVLSAGQGIIRVER